MKIFKALLVISVLFLTFNSSAFSAPSYQSEIADCSDGKYKAKMKVIGRTISRTTIKVTAIRFRFLPETSERNNNKLTVKIKDGTGLRPQTIIGCGGKCNTTIMVPYTKWKEITKVDKLARDGKWGTVKANFRARKGTEIWIQATFDKPLWDASCTKELTL